MTRGWIGVDLDGVLAFYDGWKGANVIGDPIPAMVTRVKAWLTEGRDVRIFTARVGKRYSDWEPNEQYTALRAIEDWCLRNIGIVLPVTCEKDFHMVELWDDRCVQVRTNVGEPIVESWAEEKIIKDDGSESTMGITVGDGVIDPDDPPALCNEKCPDPTVGPCILSIEHQ